MQSINTKNRSTLFHVCAALIFLAAGGLVSAALKFELTYDYLLYHHYNGFAFLNGRLGTDIAPASVATYYNPLLDALLYKLNAFFRNDRGGYYFITGLPFGAMLFVLFEISLLFFDFKTLKGKLCCAAVSIIGATGVAAWFQIGTATHEIPAAALVLSALYLILRFPDHKKTYAAAGFLLGAAAGLKLTAAVYCVSTGIALILSYRTLAKPKTFVAWLAAGGLAGFAATDGFWAVMLWNDFQNPFFPFWNKVFKSPFYLNENYVDRLHLDGVTAFQLAFLPFYLINHPYTSNVGALQELTDFRFAALFVTAACALAFRCRLSPVMKKAALWLGVSYVVWLTTAANLRFAVPVETLTAVVLVAAFSRWKKPASLIGEALYLSAAVIGTAVFASTAVLSAPWGFGTRADILNERVVLPENAVLELYRFPLAGVAAEIAETNPTAKIVLYAPSDNQWHGWDIARMGKMNGRRTDLIAKAAVRAALFQDAFGLVYDENPELLNWDCRALDVSANFKTVLFSDVKLCIEPKK